jgi:predicted RNA-binding Zn-ribbon protein involved in translation (DUF1610 family)
MINRRIRWHPWVCPFCMLMGALIVCLVLVRFDLVWPAIALFLVLTILSLYTAFRLGLCPKCGATIYPLLMYHSKVRLTASVLPEKVKFCPLCGLDFDASLDGQSGVELAEPSAGGNAAPPRASA